jgi:hypothetical protein
MFNLAIYEIFKNFKKKQRAKLDLKVVLLVLLTPLLVTLVFPLAIGAQGEVESKPKVTNITVEVMPEYDDPRVLVILRPTLSPDTKLPARVTFTIPRKDTEINMACEILENNGMACKPTEVVDKGDYQEVSFVAQTRRTLMFEYYYNPFGAVKVGTKKFNYKFISNFAHIDQLNLAIQKPRKAENFRISPAATNTTEDPTEKLTYYLYSFNDISEGQELSFDVSYKKDDPATSVSPKGSAPGEGVNTSGFSVSKLLPLIAVLAIIGIIIYWMLPGWQKKPVPTAKVTSGAREGTRRKTGKPGRKRTAYCHNCGNKVQPGDKFCAECGTQLRS